MLDKLTFGQSNWAIGLVVVGLLLALLVIRAYRQAKLSRPVIFGSVLLKLTAIAAILFSLLDPTVATQRPLAMANRVAIVLDSSRSMNALIGAQQAEEEAGLLSDAWRDELSSQARWQQDLEEAFRVRRYRFGGRLEAVDSLEGTSLRDTSSSIENSLKLLAERLNGVPTAGVVLISDGQANGGGNHDEKTTPHFDWKNLGIPIYPVDLGAASKEPDLRLTNIAVRQSDFESAPVTILASIEASGLKGKVAEVKLQDGTSNVVETRRLTIESQLFTETLEFRFRPHESGVQQYQINASLVDKVRDAIATHPTADSVGTGEELNPKLSSVASERILSNNTRKVIVDRGHGPYRILYVAGRPNWEHKYLQRAIAEDAELKLTSLIRIANKEPKFSFRDTNVESANPLFAGFEDISAEEKEQYNEPVFVRIGVTDGMQHQKGFPQSAEELFEYQAVIIDDLEHDFFSSDQQSLLRRFVSIRGGGLLVLGGTESMRGKGFRESVLAQLLPIYGENNPDESNPDAMSTSSKNAPPLVQYRFTRQGWLEPFLRVTDNERDEQKRIEAMPPFQVINEAGGLKPGAVVLSEAVNSLDESQSPALITQRFGKGKSAVLLTGDMWRWGLHNEKPESPPLYQAWRQMVRWLIADVPQPIEMEVAPAENSPSGQAATIYVQVRTVEFAPREDVVVEVEIIKPDGAKLIGRAEPSEKRQGSFEFPILSIDEGGYRALVKVVDSEGNSLGETQKGWVHEPSVAELEKVGSDRSMLERIAASTGGEVLEPSDLASFSTRLSRRPVPVTEIQLRPLWNNGWVLGIVLGCLAGEWWLRRKHGLP